MSTSLYRMQHRWLLLRSSGFFLASRQPFHRPKFPCQIAGGKQQECKDRNKTCKKLKVKQNPCKCSAPGVSRRTHIHRELGIVPSLGFRTHAHADARQLTGHSFLTKALSVLTLAFFRGETLGPIHVIKANLALLLISSPVSNRT